MPATLRKNGDVLALRIGGLGEDEFKDTLQRVKSIPGRRYNADDKTWEFPAEEQTALRLINVVQPDLDAEVQAWVKAANARIADEITSALPGDAVLKDMNQSVLYPYQRAAVDFLAEHPRSLLADEMGLGKTIMGICAVREWLWREEEGGRPLGTSFRALVVAPNSMAGKWVEELYKWDLNRKPIVWLNGRTAAQRGRQLRDFDEGWLVVNWEKLRVHPELADIEWTAVIADEVHRAKNRKAKQTQALWKLDAPMKLGLSGTPLLNSPDELWSILVWLRPEEYGPRSPKKTGYWRFFNDYVEAYEDRWGGRVITGVKNPDQLRFMLSDKLIRRTKRSVGLDLPEKLPPVRVPIELHPKQRRLYEDAEREWLLEVERAVVDGAVTAEQLETAPLEKLAYLIPNGGARLVRMRQIASTPATLGGEDVSAKLDAAIEIIEDAAPDKQFVVFTLYRETANCVRRRLEKRKISATTLTGDDTPEARTNTVTAFQNGDIRVLACTIAAGGQGLTLTAADTAIFIERDWTPAINRQAEDRLHRIGQRSPVTIYILDAVDTIDVGRVALVNRTKELIEGTVLGQEAV